MSASIRTIELLHNSGKAAIQAIPRGGEAVTKHKNPAEDLVDVPAEAGIGKSLLQRGF
ncbi:MAG: hypothetical protein AB2L11_01480 [Syntrophobacteraceae bacterium]